MRWTASEPHPELARESESGLGFRGANQARDAVKPEFRGIEECDVLHAARTGEERPGLAGIAKEAGRTHMLTVCGSAHVMSFAVGDGSFQFKRQGGSLFKYVRKLKLKQDKMRAGRIYEYDSYPLACG